MEVKLAEVYRDIQQLKESSTSEVKDIGDLPQELEGIKNLFKEVTVIGIVVSKCPEGMYNPNGTEGTTWGIKIDNGLETIEIVTKHYEVFHGIGYGSYVKVGLRGNYIEGTLVEGVYNVQAFTVLGRYVPDSEVKETEEEVKEE